MRFLKKERAASRANISPVSFYCININILYVTLRPEQKEIVVILYLQCHLFIQNYVIK